MRIIPTVKTGILVALVGASVLLSEMLWTGGWGTTGEVPFSPETTAPQGTAPSLKQVTSPYRIVLESRSDHGTSMQIPGTSDYQDWLKTLASAHIHSMHSVSPIDEAKISRFVRFDFGTSLHYDQLTTWIPGLHTSVLPISADEVYLFQTQPNGPVMLGLSSQNQMYEAQTDLKATSLADTIAHELTLEPWVLWSRDSNTLIPESAFSMFSLEVQMSEQPIVPLVHSFFVNPEALTSVQEDPNTILWTDGSRAVLWAKKKDILTYADPNAPDTSLRPMQVSDILAYVKSHGGADGSSLLFENPSGVGETQFVLQPYEYGFPVLGGQRSISIDVINGRIAQYQQPISRMSIHSRTMVQVIGSDQLKAILHTLMPSTPVNELSIELGYLLTEIHGHSATLMPVYSISQSGIPLWDINARTGLVVKGMNPS